MSVQIEWNNSALSCLQRCGEQFRRRYIEKERMPPSLRQVRGTVVHRVASAGLLKKLETKAATSAAEARDLAADAFEIECTRGVVDDEGVGKGYSKDFAIDLSGFHAERLAPAINPVGVERKITVKPKDSDLVIHGTIDLIDATPTGEMIRDLKTTEKSPSSGAAEDSQQLTMYAMIRLAEVGTLPERLTLDYLVRTPAKLEKKHVPLHTTRDRQDVTTLVQRINTAVDAVTKGVFMPTNPENWWCSAAWCDFHATCPYVRRGARPKN